MNYIIDRCSLDDVRRLCELHHGYGSAGGVATYCWCVRESGRIVAAYSWQPPPPGAARAVCPEEPAGVLALSRMVAVPRGERALNHVSRPLRMQMRRLIDRTRWPVLVTYSDEGQGHRGHVYKCSGWHPTARVTRPVFELGGVRASRYSDGRCDDRSAVRVGTTVMQRWEHWACGRGSADDWMRQHGWYRVPSGRTYRSGAPGFKWAQIR